MRTALLALAALAMTATEALAWGQTIHRVTGEIATAYLSPEAKKAVTEILGPETLAEASTWPDFMRSSEEEFWRREAGPYHYVTIPKGKTYAEVGAPKEGDAITALAKFRAILKDPAAKREDKALALRFIVHIIGDLHQPLHAGDGTDRGGNDFLVVWDGEVTNLHSVWDTALPETENLSYTEWTRWLMAKITPEQVRTWTDPNPVTWVTESAAIRDTIYPTDRRLGFRYTFDHIGTVRTRASQGGVRIAAYLNDVFASK